MQTCKWGHEIAGDNVANDRGRAVCRRCKRARAKRHYQKHQMRILAHKRRQYARKVLRLDAQMLQLASEMDSQP